MATTAEDRCKELAVEQLREGAWTAAASSMTDEEIHEFVDDCLAEARS